MSADPQEWQWSRCAQHVLITPLSVVIPFLVVHPWVMLDVPRLAP